MDSIREKHSEVDTRLNALFG
jgi:hypothetical protein